MKPLSRREFGTGLLLAAPAMAAPTSRSMAQLVRHATTEAPSRSSTADGLTSWPKGYAPDELGAAVANRFIPAPHYHPDRIVYPEVCAWYGALELARVCGNHDALVKLQARFKPLFGAEAALLPPKGNHVDFSMFGALPLELYILSKVPGITIDNPEKYLDLGLAYADAQWRKPDAGGLTTETRFWIDDMYMITIVQVQAFRATGNAVYLDRAATGFL